MRWSIFLGLVVLGGSIFDVAAQEPDVAKLAAGLSAGTAAQQHAAADALADLGSGAKAAVPQLTAALASKDAQLRWRAVRALGMTGDAKAIDTVRKAASDADAGVRAQAIFALGRLGAKDDATITTIVARVTDPDAAVRRATVAALRSLREQRDKIRPLIVKVLEDSDPSVVMPALHTLAEGGAEVVPSMIEALGHKEACYWACLVLAEIGPAAKDAVPALVKVLADERPEVRIQALVALGEIGPDARSASTAVAKAMDDAFVSVQYAAAFALGRIGDKAQAAAVEKAAKSEDHFLRLIGAWAAAKIDPENKEKLAAAAKVLVAGLLDEHENHRVAAARGLLELNAPEVVSKELDAAAASLSESQIDRAMDAFAALGPRVVPRATELLKDSKRRERAMKVLGKIGPDAAPAVPALIELLKDQDPKVRTEALFTLASIGSKASAAIESGIKALADTDRDVMLTAGYFLDKMGPEAKAAAPALRKLLQSKDELTQITAAHALLSVDPDNPDNARVAVPVMVAALKNPLPFIRGEAAMTLGDLGKAAANALPALEAAAKDEDQGVRAAAAEAVKKIRG
jgi:HEAT repeat protein